MATPPFSVEIENLAEVRKSLAKLQGKAADLSPLMRNIAGLLEDEGQQAFEDEADPVTGGSWEPLTPDYVEAKRGGDEHPILQLGGDLAKLQTEAGHDYAQVGSGEPYAAIHQFGGTSGMPPGPAAVPARPYLGVSDAAREELLNLVEDYLAAN